MPRRHLTVAAVSRIKSPTSGQVDHFDAGYPGLALRVSYGGGRSWVYFYRLHGRQRRLTLGPWPALTLEGAEVVHSITSSAGARSRAFPPYQESTSRTALPATRRSRNCSATVAISRQLRSTPI